jgi:hypothetical protein
MNVRNRKDASFFRCDRIDPWPMRAQPSDKPVLLGGSCPTWSRRCRFARSGANRRAYGGQSEGRRVAAAEPCSRILRLAAGVAVLLAICLRYVPAAAEEPPPPESVETCTLEKQQRSGEECLMCGASDGDPAKCLKRLAHRGYQRRCPGSGESAWLELWCRPLGSGGQATPIPGAVQGLLGY